MRRIQQINNYENLSRHSRVINGYFIYNNNKVAENVQNRTYSLKIINIYFP